MAINEQMEALAQKVWERSGGQFPVNPLRVAEHYNIPVYGSKLEGGVSGGLSKINGEIKIHVNTSESMVRRKFTVAHELGHYFAHMPSDRDYAVVDYHRDHVSAMGNDADEIEANNFAAALLMNREMIKWYWNEYKSVPLIAKEFGVSEDAARHRLINLGLMKANGR